MPLPQPVVDLDAAAEIHHRGDAAPEVGGQGLVERGLARLFAVPEDVPHMRVRFPQARDEEPSVPLEHRGPGPRLPVTRPRPHGGEQAAMDYDVHPRDGIGGGAVDYRYVPDDQVTDHGRETPFGWSCWLAGSMIPAARWSIRIRPGGFPP